MPFTRLSKEANMWRVIWEIFKPIAAFAIICGIEDAIFGTCYIGGTIGALFVICIFGGILTRPFTGGKK